MATGSVIEGHRVRRRWHCLAIAVVLCVGTSCVDDSFQNPLSDAASSKPEPRLIGDWAMMAAEPGDGVQICRVTLDAEDENCLKIQLSADMDFIASTLKLGESRFIYVEPVHPMSAYRGQAKPSEDAGCGWLLGYEQRPGGEKKFCVLAEDKVAEAIRAGDIDGSIVEHTSIVYLLWQKVTKIPVVRLDSAKSRLWLGVNAEKILGRSGSLPEMLAKIRELPPNTKLEPGGETVRVAGLCDRTLVGESVAYERNEPLCIISVKATDDPLAMNYSIIDDPDFGPPQKLLATEIAGASYFTAAQEDEKQPHVIFRYEFIGEDTLMLIPPDHDYLVAAALTKLLPTQPGTMRQSAQRSRGSTFTASTEALRAFVTERADDCFPDALRSDGLIVLRRSQANPDAGKTPSKP